MSARKTPVTIGNARFTVYSPGCIRLEYAHGGSFSDGPSLLVGPKPAKPVPAECTLKGKKLHIKTAQVELFYEDNGEAFSGANLRIEHRDFQGRKTVWTPGKKDAGNLGTVTRCLDQWKWCGGPQHFPVEGILSTDGGHYLADEPRVYWNKEHDWPECRGHAVVSDGYFFAYGADYKAALKDFITVLGPIPMVPRWTFGFWYSRWYAYRDREVIDLVKRYRREGVPMDVMVIDTDWRGGWGGYDWNKKFFPNPEKTFAELHRLGCRTSLNDHPGYDNYDSLPANDSHIPAIRKRLGALPHQGQWSCDWSRKEAVRAWNDILLGPFHDQGMDFWWIDGWIKPPFVGTDSQLWANRQYFELAEKKTRKRGMILARWGGIGSHRYPVQFSGDTPSEWHMLQFQVEFTARSGNLGAAYWSHDIGGFFGKQVDEELFIRWAQFGAMSPVFRTHSDHGDREPWKFSDKAKRLFRKQTRIRYALAPYFYTLAREAHETGLPIVRPLYLEYNDNDGGALWRKHQYLVGRDLFVVPADGPVDKTSRTLRKRAYFPNATWYGLETDEVILGMRDGTIEIPLERIPTYVRGGAIIPSQKVGNAIGTRAPEELHFDYFPDPVRASEYSLYEDDGESCDHEKGRFAVTRVRARATGRAIELNVDAPKGSYAGMPKQRRYVVRVRVPDTASVARVEARVGRGAVRVLKHRFTRECLAGEVKSGHQFCEVQVRSANEAVALRFVLA